MEDVLRALHRGLGAAALGLALGQSPVQALDDGDQRLAAVLLEKLLIKGVDMVEAAVIAYGGCYARYRVNERLSLLAADDRAHERPGIHRRIVHAGADKRREIIIKLVLRRSAYLQRGNFNNCADSVLSVNYFFSDRIHRKSTPIIYYIPIIQHFRKFFQWFFQIFFMNSARFLTIVFTAKA